MLVERDNDMFDMLTVLAGVIGPAVLGDNVQYNFHRLIKGDRVNGWDNQLCNEPGLILSYERRWRPFFSRISPRRRNRCIAQCGHLRRQCVDARQDRPDISRRPKS
ncbi:hypothetical protein CW354_17960 [Marinicaulis flavus]|uniref:Uncharacterized protein n=1 Tax=Hyphococcus luteus TaxID=2058213 RepID=A0A2S7K177_9PROT|nr:hypothetical protein CW354_17960 [Marinicaulis flavus]